MQPSRPNPAHRSSRRAEVLGAPPGRVMRETPTAPAGRQIIEAYGPGRIRISGTIHQRPVIILPDAVVDWPVATIADLSVDSLIAVASVRPPIEILIIGCGPRMAFIRPDLRQALRASGLVVDAMDTGAACRTYNVLLAEDRRVAAALIPLPAQA